MMRTSQGMDDDQKVGHQQVIDDENISMRMRKGGVWNGLMS